MDYVIDLETRPDPLLLADEGFWSERRDGLEPPKNYKDPLKIEEWRTAAITEQRDMAALAAHTGIIVSVGIVDVDDDNNRFAETVLDVSHDRESMLLNRAGRWLSQRGGERNRLVGWYIRGFDIPFWIGRASVAQAGMPSWFPHAKDYRAVVDLKEILGGGHLSDWMRTFGLGAKTHEGAELLQISLEELHQHLLDDLSATVEIARRTAWLWRK